MKKKLHTRGANGESLQNVVFSWGFSRSHEIIKQAGFLLLGTIKSSSN